MHQDIVSKVDSFVQQNKQAIIQDIAELVSISSVEGAAAPDAPYGLGPRKALETALAIANRLGFETSHDGWHVGWAELKGKQDKYIATITHVDIVPVGDGWDGDPLVLRQQGDWLIGRGVNDDKGPTILCLYAAKFLLDSGLPLEYSLRVLMGSNEESGMTDVEHYLDQQPEPVFCFSPDSVFPVCNGEKGVYSGEFVSGHLQGNIVEFEGGVASNVIPDKAHCVIKADAEKLQTTSRIQVTKQGNLTRLDASGIGGHAADPTGTINAIGLLVDYLLENKLCNPEETEFLTLLQKIHSATDGSGLGVDCSDDVFDPLTCIGGMIQMQDGKLAQNINIRFPTSTSGEKLTANLTAIAAQYGAGYQQASSAEPFHIPADSPAIQALLQTYHEVTGRPAETFTMGGGTYARHFKHAVSFGPQHRDVKRPDGVGDAHQPNEGLSISNMLQALKIYILALCRLQHLDL